MNKGQNGQNHLQSDPAKSGFYHKSDTYIIIASGGLDSVDVRIQFP